MPVEQVREGDHIRAKKGSFHVVSDVVVVRIRRRSPDAQARIGLFPGQARGDRGRIAAPRLLS
jgi:hypothetical protein